MKIKNEIWVDSYYFGEIYEVSNKGRVRNKKTQKMLTNSLNPYGYYRVILSNKGKRVFPKVHRLVYLSFYPDTPLSLDIHHIDHVKTNNEIENLGPIDKRTHTSMHTRERIANGTWNLKDSAYRKPGKQNPRYRGIDIAAICSKTNTIKYITSGATELKSHGFNWGCVFNVIRGKRKTHKDLVFREIYSHNYKVGDFFGEDVRLK